MSIRSIRRSAHARMGDELLMRRLLCRVMVRMVGRAMDKAALNVLRDHFRTRAEIYGMAMDSFEEVLLANVRRCAQ